MREYNWKFVKRLAKDEHRLFLDTHSGDYAIADNSGPYPDNTDDGVLWIIPNQKLQFKTQGQGSLPIRVINSEGKISYAFTSLDGGLVLQNLFGWSLTLLTYTGIEVSLKEVVSPKTMKEEQTDVDDAWMLEGLAWAKSTSDCDNGDAAKLFQTVIDGGTATPEEIAFARQLAQEIADESC